MKIILNEVSTMKYLLPIIVSLIFAGCNVENNSVSEVWTAFVFPNKVNTKRSIQVGQFPSLEICQKNALIKLEEINAVEIGFVECGLNCSFHDGMKTTICERMVTKK